MIDQIRKPSKALQAIAAVVTLTMLSQSSVALAQTTDVTKIAIGTSETAQAKIVSLVREFNAAQQDKNADKPAAIERFLTGLSESNVTERDIKEYAKSKLDRESYLKFSSTLSERSKQAEEEGMMPEEVIAMFASELNKTDKQTITGCAGLVSGVVLAAAAITVGIIGLVKMRPVSAIQRKYNKKRRKAQNEYNNDIYRIDQKEQELNRDIMNLNEQNKQYANDIVFKTGQALGTNDPALKDQLLREIQDLQERISNNNSRITQLSHELQNYQNPVYVANLKQQELNEYNAQVREYDEKEADLVASAPDNQALGKKMLIGAAAGAGVSALLIWDGARSCGGKDTSSGRPTGRR